MNDKELELIELYISRLVEYLEFSKDDVENEIDFYSECDDNVNQNDLVYNAHYGIYDILSKHFLFNSIKPKYNELFINYLTKK